MHELFLPLVFICLFVWWEAIKRYLKISRNHAVTQARQKSCKEKNTALRHKKKKKQNVLLQQNATKWITRRANWEFYKIQVEKKKRSNFHHRLNKYFKEQLCTFLKRNEYSPYNINHR